MSLNRKSQFCFSLGSISGNDGKQITTEMLKEVLCLEKEVRGEIPTVGALSSNPHKLRVNWVSKEREEKLEEKHHPIILCPVEQ